MNLSLIFIIIFFGFYVGTNLILEEIDDTMGGEDCAALSLLLNIPTGLILCILYSNIEG